MLGGVGPNAHGGEEERGHIVAAARPQLVSIIINITIIIKRHPKQLTF